MTELYQWRCLKSEKIRLLEQSAMECRPANHIVSDALALYYNRFRVNGGSRRR